jgi:hypothetical protein
VAGGLELDIVGDNEGMKTYVVIARMDEHQRTFLVREASIGAAMIRAVEGIEDCLDFVSAEECRVGSVGIPVNPISAPEDGVAVVEVGIMAPQFKPAPEATAGGLRRSPRA